MNRGGSGTTPPASAAARATELAMVGLAARLIAPSLLHTLKGRLHNIALVTELLQREAASLDADALRTASRKRTATVQAEVEAIVRQLGLLEGLAGTDATESRHCAVDAALEEIVHAARLEGARHEVVVRWDLGAGDLWVTCAPATFRQLLLICASHAIRHAQRGATLSVVARVDAGEALFDFGTAPQSGADDDPDASLDAELIGELAQLAGARFDAAPTLRLTFALASR